MASSWEHGVARTIAPQRVAPEGCPLSSQGDGPRWPGPPQQAGYCWNTWGSGRRSSHRPMIHASQQAERQAGNTTCPGESETTPHPSPGRRQPQGGRPSCRTAICPPGFLPHPTTRVHFGSVCTQGGATCPSDPVRPGERGGTQQNAVPEPPKRGPGAAGALRSWARTGGPWRACPPTYSVVIHLLECLVADGALKDDPLEQVGFVTGHQLHADHLSLPHRHVAEHLRGGTRRTATHHAAHSLAPRLHPLPPSRPHPCSRGCAPTPLQGHTDSGSNLGSATNGPCQPGDGT